jgi:hypothetical protein
LPAPTPAFSSQRHAAPSSRHTHAAAARTGTRQDGGLLFGSLSRNCLS